MFTMVFTYQFFNWNSQRKSIFCTFLFNILKNRNDSHHCQQLKRLLHRHTSWYFFSLKSLFGKYLTSAHNNGKCLNLETNRRFERSALGLYSRNVDENRFSSTIAIRIWNGVIHSYIRSHTCGWWRSLFLFLISHWLDINMIINGASAGVSVCVCVWTRTSIMCYYMSTVCVHTTHSTENQRTFT